MRKLAVVVAASGLVAASTGIAAQRVVVGEMMTNTSCPYCYDADLALDNIMQAHPELAVIRYHVWWPSPYDPFYTFNSSENTARNNYYGNNYTPHLIIDGGLDGHEYYNNWQGLLLSRQGVPSPLRMEIYGDYDSQSRICSLRVDMIAEDNISQSSLKLRIALIESNIYWQAPNGGIYHNQTMRDMIPTASGTVVSLQQPGDSVTVEQTFTVDPSLVDTNCDIIAFVQSDQDRWILQAVKEGLTTLPSQGFVPGDANGSGEVNVLDVTYLVNFLAGNGPPPDPYLAGDANGSCSVNVLDVTYLVNYLANVGDPPVAGDC